MPVQLTHECDGMLASLIWLPKGERRLECSEDWDGRRDNDNATSEARKDEHMIARRLPAINSATIKVLHVRLQFQE